MELLLNFKESLMTGENPCSPVTAKNYISDLKNFIEWHEKTTNQLFTAENITEDQIREYKASSLKLLSAATLDRHLSSLRKFYNYLENTQNISNPFNSITSSRINDDPWNMRSFKNFLHNYNSSTLTIKNYSIDVVQFLRWLELVSGNKTAYKLRDQNIYKYITNDALEEYKFRLLAIAKLSPASINRKLSSLRRYITWGVTEGLIKEQELGSLYNSQKIATEIPLPNPVYNLDLTPSLNTEVSDPQAYSDSSEQLPDAFDEKEKSYSSFPPFRLAQKMAGFGGIVIDGLLTLPILKLIDQIEYTKWTLTGKNIFMVTKLVQKASSDKLREKIIQPLAFLTPNFKKSFYEPLSISAKWLPTHKKIIHHLKYTRPKWYRIYHSYALVHYVHLGLLILALTLSGSLAYESFKGSNQNLRSVLAGSDFTRILNYKGKLSDRTGSPITDQTSVRFALYNDPSDKGSALVWQEIHTISPDTNGSFTVSLGALSPLSQNLFLQNEKVYLGIRIGEDQELLPRQQLPTTSYAGSADTVQGLRPITDPLSGEKNTLLALDSIGNLTIGGNANPTFQATGGVFALSGQSLLLATNPGTNTDIILSPDGLGKIDLQKPLYNSLKGTSDTLGSDAVTIEDNLVVIATSSAQPTLLLSQNGDSPIISAISNGTAKFTLHASGNLGIGTTSVAEGKLQVADGNDGYGATIIAKDGGAVLMASNGTAPLTIGNNTGGKAEINLRIFPSGEIDYNNSSKAEPRITLPTNKSLFISGGKGITIAGQIIPATDAMYNLGSDTLRWNKIYVNEIITGTSIGTFGHISLKDGIVSPANISNDIAIGGNSTSSATFQVTGSGVNSGSIRTKGSLTFAGPNPKITISSNTSFDIETLDPLDTKPTPKFSFLSNGALGIGTTTPLFRLDLVDSQNATVSAFITNSSISANAGVLALKLGNPNPQETNSFIAFINGSGQTIGSITGSSSGGVVYKTTGSDFAEYFQKANPYEVLLAGDIVCLTSRGTVTKCTDPTSTLVGVVSGQAGFVGNSNYQNDPKYILIGLLGQLPVTYSKTSGEIYPGDPLTVGADGKATTSKNAGQIIGRALEGSSTNTDKINVYLSLSWHDPKAKIASNGFLNPELYNSIGAEFDQQASSKASPLTKVQNILTSSLIATTLTATDIATGSLTIAGKSLNDYIIEKIAENLQRLTTQELISGIASIDTLKTTIITPLAYDSEIALAFRRDVLEIQNTTSKKVVAQIDKDGNARFNGSISAQDASISGTLRADKLIADDIELSEIALAKIRDKTRSSSASATYLSNITNIYQSTSSGAQQAEQDLASPPPDTSDTLNTPSALSYLPASSLSATLAYVPDLKAKFARFDSIESGRATFEQGLMSFGPTSTADLSVAGGLSINGSLILAENSINVLGQDLELQSLRQGNLSIMAGRVTIDTEGNMEVKGDANFAKNLRVNDTLFTRLISPLPGSDLTIRLNSSNSKSSSLKIEDSSGSAKFSVNSLGELIASGGAVFAGDLDSKRGKFQRILTQDLNIIRAAQADTSLTETIASASAGTATISKYQKERTILSPYVKEDSLIYITAISDTAGLTPYIARQTTHLEPDEDRSQPRGAQGSFTIQVIKPTTKDIKINWWIIN